MSRIVLHLVGIGSGDPHHLTRAAERAIRAADCILLPRKGADRIDLLDLRRTLCAAVLGEAGLRETPRIVEFDLPGRAVDGAYRADVAAWHDAIAVAWAARIAAHLPCGGNLALLVWGDPSLYDSTLRIADRLIARGLDLETRVVPGITSLQLLTAAHAIPLNALAAPVLVTTGRRLRAEGWPADAADSVAVMLDGDCAFTTLDPRGIRIWWGACLGMARQRLVAGDLCAVAEEIVRVRAALRAEHGWVMDTYLLRRGADAEPGAA
jgi:precorrin-6A synthase